MPGRVIYVVRSWPRLSQTFIVDEVLALERRGRDLSVFSLIHSGRRWCSPRSPWSGRRSTISTGGTPPAPSAGPPPPQRAAPGAPGYAATLATALRHPRLAAGYGDCSTLRCFHHATQVAEAVARLRARGDRVEHLHAHFAHDPALVGLFAARIAGLGSPSPAAETCSRSRPLR